MNKIYILTLTIFLNLSYTAYKYYDYKKEFRDYEMLNTKYLNLQKELDSKINDKFEDESINQDDKTISSNSLYL